MVRLVKILANWCLILNLPNIPDIMVRGEIIMSKETFDKKYSKEYANPRSAVVGILPPTRPDTAKYRDLDYVGV